MIKWYENLSRDLDIPLIMIDIPFNPDYEVSDAEVAYVKAQFLDAIKQLEEITGMDFFPSLGNREEEIIEDQVDLRSWNINK